MERRIEDKPNRCEATPVRPQGALTKAQDDQGNQYKKRATRISSTLDPRTDSHIKSLVEIRYAPAAVLMLILQEEICQVDALRQIGVALRR